MIDGSQKRNRRLAFELQNSHVCEKRSNNIVKHSYPKNMTERISVCTLPGNLKIIDISQNFTNVEI